jgi:hypothetical protein
MNGDRPKIHQTSLLSFIVFIGGLDSYVVGPGDDQEEEEQGTF